MRTLTLLFVSLAATFGQVVDIPNNIQIKNLPVAINNNVNWLKNNSIKTPAAWAVGTAYHVGDTVLYGGNVFLALTTCTGVVPGPDAVSWATIGSTLSSSGQWSGLLNPLSATTINSYIMNRLGANVYITSVWCKTDTGTAQLQFAETNGAINVPASPVACTSAGATSSGAPISFGANDTLNMTVSGLSGSPTIMSLAVTYGPLPSMQEWSSVTVAPGGIAPTSGIPNFFNNHLGHGVTVAEVWCQTDTGTVDLQFRKNGVNALTTAATTCNSTGVSNTLFTSGEPAMANGDGLTLVTSGITGTPTRLSFNVSYH